MSSTKLFNFKGKLAIKVWIQKKKHERSILQKKALHSCIQEYKPAGYQRIVRG